MSKYSVIVVMIALILVAVMPVSSLNETETVAIATTTPIPTATPTVSITITTTPTTTTTTTTPIQLGIWPSLEITPDQATLPSGTHVTVRTDIPVNSFPSNRNLLLSTELDNPKWTYYLVLNGVVNQRPVVTENTWSLQGWDLSYPSSITESVLIRLEGTTPATSAQVSKKIISIQETDSTNKYIFNSKILIERLVGNPTPTPTPIPTLTVTTSQTTVLTTANTAPIVTEYTTPIPSPTTKVTTKSYTPWPTNTPTQPSPLGVEIGIIATIGVALLILKRK